MKFAVNHPYKFRNWSLAFMTGFLQFFVAVSCEVLCYWSLIQSDNVVDIMTNFLGVYVIAELDVIYFRANSKITSMENKLNNDVVGILCCVERTSSKNSMRKIEANKVQRDKDQHCALLKIEMARGIGQIFNGKNFSINGDGLNAFENSEDNSDCLKDFD